MKYANLLIKPASSLCNLRCKYCFYEDEAKNRTQPSMGIMKEYLANNIIRQVFEAVDADGMVIFAFQGGEPTVAGLTYFQHFVETVKQCKPRTVNVHYAIQTNGTLLDETWARFFYDEHFLVGLSLDGFKEAHDMHRVDAQGNGTWERVMTAKALLEHHKVEYNVLCVVTNLCARHPGKTYRRLKNRGVRYMQFIACMDPIGHMRGQEPWSLTPDAYGDFLCRLFDLWYQDWADGDYCSIRLFEDYVHILLNDGASTCATCGKCGSYLVVEGDGSAYPCDFFVLDEWKIGSLAEKSIAELASGAKAVDFLRWGNKKPAECAACPYGGICGGGCKNDWYMDETGPHNYFCASFKALLRHAMPRMQAIARAEAAARRQF